MKEETEVDIKICGGILGNGGRPKWSTLEKKKKTKKRKWNNELIKNFKNRNNDKNTDNKNNNRIKMTKTSKE